MSAIDNHRYFLNSSDSTLDESKFIAQSKNKNENKDIENKYRDSLLRESPNANIARPPAIEIDDKDKRKLGKKINQYGFTLPEFNVGVISHQCINEIQIMPRANNNAPKFLSLDGSLPTGTFPEYATLKRPIKIRIVGPTMKPNNCPTALEGDSGTVHGLAKTKPSPINERKIPIFARKDEVLT